MSTPSDIPPVYCTTDKCIALAEYVVHWPGQTNVKCNPCRLQSINVAQAMGFKLSTEPLREGAA